MAKKHPLQQTAPGELERHVHHHPSESWAILARLVVALIAVFFAWHGLVFLADQAGASRPTHMVAQIVFWVGGILIISWAFSLMLSDHLDRYYTHRQVMESERTNQMRHRQLLAGSMATDSRRLGDDQRLAALIYTVMLEAYDYLAKHKRFRGQYRPWSRRSASEHVLISLGEKSPVGEVLGAKVRPALLAAGIIDDDDQVNLKHFPDFSSVQRLLYQPVLVSAQQPEAGQNNWSLIE